MSKVKFRWGRFLFRLTAVLCVLGAVFVGGYFMLDKLVVPKYFGEYGIKNMSDLVGMMRTLYSTPHESQIVTNGHTASDLSSAASKLSAANYPIREDGSFDFDAFEAGVKGTGDIYISDRELASVIDKLLESQEFSDLLPELKNFNTLNISLLEITISPVEQEDSSSEPPAGSAPIVGDGSNLDGTTSSAHIKFIARLDTTNVRSLMAEQMQIPLFLLNMIIPKTLFITVNYNVSISNSAEGSVWTVADGGLAVNGSTEKQSEVLLNLLIKFIFGDDTNMTPELLLDNLDSMIVQGVDLFGKIEFTTDIGVLHKNGIYFLPVD